MSSIICRCGKVLAMRVRIVGLSPVITIHDKDGCELEHCPLCSRDMKEIKEQVIGIRTLAQRWGPGSRRSKKG